VDPSEKAAWISSCVALVVAVIGVIATGVAQWRGSKTAHANALALFKRQADEQAQILSTEAMERRRTASIAERRTAYAKFLRAKRRLADETYKLKQLKERFEAIGAERADDSGWDARRVAELDAVIPKIDAAHDAVSDASDDTELSLQEIFILAPLGVADAAIAWHHHAEHNDPVAHSRFLNAARTDVGAEPLDRLPVS
jgi:hypothetical protein